MVPLAPRPQQVGTEWHVTAVDDVQDRQLPPAASGVRAHTQHACAASFCGRGVATASVAAARSSDAGESSEWQMYMMRASTRECTTQRSVLVVPGWSYAAELLVCH
jgi:hypothetical protein